LAALLVLVLLLAACGGNDVTPEVVIITATYTPEPVVIVITATHTPTPDSVEPQAEPTLPPAPTEEQPAEPVEPTTTLQPTVEAISTLPPTKVAATQAPVATNTPKPTSVPQASLASYRVAYSNFYGGDRYDEYKLSVWMMRGDGQQAGELLRPGFEPSFSQDGNKIAYYRPFIGVWMYDLSTKSNGPVVSADLAEFGSLSPDGQRLVFHEWNEVWWFGDVSLYVVNADGSGRTKLVPGMRPAWSPKGGLIAFDTCRGTSCGIHVIQPNGQGFRQVTNDDGGGATWAPDGNKIVYYSRADGDAEIYVVNLDGSGRKQLTNNNGNDALPVFSPDGKYIYFLSDQNGTAWAIRAMRADGSDVKTLREVGILVEYYQFCRLWVTWW